MNKGLFLGRRKRKFPKYNPSHEEINRAVSEFLNKGGEIKLINPEDEPIDLNKKSKGGRFLADDYLMEQGTSSIESLI